MSRRYFSIGTARPAGPEDAAASDIAQAVNWLLTNQNEDGTWAGPDSLDKFISTTHVLMTLMAVGFSPTTPRLSAAFEYLNSLDKEKHLSFYWRSGALLNIPKYRDTVVADAKYIWKFRDRVAVHRDYPIHFFLLKLLRFGDLRTALDFGESDVLQRILSDWSPEVGWYDRTSITTMALSLVHDLSFRKKRDVLGKSVDYLVGRYVSLPEKVGRLNENIVDDAFSLFNLCESDFLAQSHAIRLRPIVDGIAQRLLSSKSIDPYWTSPPPFGGFVSDLIYPTAVIVRALAAYFVARDKEFMARLASFFMSALSRPLSSSDSGHHEDLRSFWGNWRDFSEDPDLCFVLMPFSPPDLTEIYERYVKASVESMGMRCVRADDIFSPGEIMRDVWAHINRASVIVAELTGKNPNVFYELGMAHVLGKKVILITQSEEVIPFDLRGVRHILYANRPSGHELLARNIKQYLETLRANLGSGRRPRAGSS